MPHATAGHVPLVVRAAARLVLTLCAALLATAGLGVATASPTSAAPSSGAPSSGAAPAVVRAAVHGAVTGTANRQRPQSRHENSAPAYRAHPDALPLGTTVTGVDVADPLLPAGRALTGAPTRAPPAPTGLPDTRAPPTSGHF
ncbi:hypothetical protein [Cryptosporangium aurantiacum]|uniref:Uncharacterized protein n=1 Tax=Cryptosporangium aurantiacum TaxID=134849 RepID=A0A1M7R8X4_9ACTN|nr:hypothetical protein [Cryptosporangium aurantiacum]SHN42696.1 hypothetical protein SAMN05443668_108303 [Cryptosporangium aurantiacum]